MNHNRNFDRTCTFSLGSGGKSGYVARFEKGEGLKIDFEVESHTLQSPDQISIVVHNVSPSTAAKVSKEFTEVSLDCGYLGSEGELFRGNIVESQYGELIDNSTTSILRIWAASAEIAYNNAVVNTTLPAGSTDRDIVERCFKAMQPFGVTMGKIVGVDLSAKRYPRAITLSGMARDYLRKVSIANGATYTLSGSQLNILAKNAPGIGSSGVILSAKTGLTSRPIARVEGIIAECLINPAIKVNTTVKIASKIISPIVTPNVLAPGSTEKQAELRNQLNSASEFRVLHYVARGSTRSQEWNMTLTTLGVGQGLNRTQASLHYDAGDSPVGLTKQ